MSIVITGASGKLGTLILNQLLHKVPANRLIACVRTRETARPLEELGITVRYCDYDHPDSLESAFTGASKLLFISSSHHDDTIRMRQHAHVIEAAKKSKVEHLLYTSFAFPEKGSIPLTHLHVATEHAIRATGIPYTFLRNALYVDFISTLDLNAAIEKGELRVPPGDWLFNSIPRQDIALAAAAVLAEPGHLNKTYELTASDPWTFSDLTAALSDLAGRPISLQQDATIQNWIYGFLSKIDPSSTSNDLEQLMGRPPTSLKESIKPFISL
ncbi:NAD(P)H dehydrogenase (quinone) [Paenibacillus algorifonticola]|uniref:NAD(P)H dehydrogenase (Quinone) n=1 Tax=Paenibacillus algorifonticola TaxID=684063 RepID=A0A1I2FQN8_9BACL|nr:NAD(P)H-binding protein [Paenibacillus algorifonticola]SFF07615.1 NAD(P)H dehydrogenase (quinone) [Paenibacillus algorifonticola]